MLPWVVGGKISSALKKLKKHIMAAPHIMTMSWLHSLRPITLHACRSTLIHDSSSRQVHETAFLATFAASGSRSCSSCWTVSIVIPRKVITAVVPLIFSVASGMPMQSCTYPNQTMQVMHECQGLWRTHYCEVIQVMEKVSHPYHCNTPF